jgi:hypothetical protein
MVFLRPNFSAIGKVKSAPKKQPAFSRTSIVPYHIGLDTYLEGGHDVSLDRVPLSSGNMAEVKVVNERV